MVSARAFIGPSVFLGLWWLSGAMGFVDPLYLASLPDVLVASQILFSREGLLDVWMTFYRTVIGFSLATVLAVPLGIFLGSYKGIYKSVEMLVDFFRSLPSPALLPTCLLIFGLGDESKIALVTFVSFWVILINTVHGVWHGSVIRVQVGQVFKATKQQILQYITFRDALPAIFIGLRTALSLSLIVVIVAEMSIGSKNGLGQKIIDSYNSYRIPNLYLFICVIGVMGFVLNHLFTLIEKRTIHWVKR